MTSERAPATIKVLLVEDDPGDARLVREKLKATPDALFEIEEQVRVAEGIERIKREGIDVVLVGLSVPDVHGIQTITRLYQKEPDVPIIVLSGMSNQSVIHDAVRQGAEDCLVKGAFSGEELARTIHYAIDRRRMRMELARARDAALESARMRSEFLANMSHEIRTPLSAIVGVTRLLIETRLGADQREMLELSRASADTLLQIVNDILDYSKITAGKMTLDDIEFEVGPTVESVTQIFAEQAAAKGVVLDSFIASEVPVRLRGDRGRLCQVLTNLVGNAVKFTASGEITVRIDRIGGAADSSMLRFQVRDTGIGIPLASQRSIFQAFAQGDSSITRRFGGTGLGLAISAQLVELMGGSIGVESDPGRGSTFWFTASFGSPAITGFTAGAADRFPLERMRVLLADSNAASARMVSDQLRAWRMRPEIVGDPADVPRALVHAMNQGDPFAIALVDLDLGVEAGIDLARAIATDPQLGHPRVVGLYSIGRRPEPGLIRTAGISAVLLKPVRQSALRSMLVSLSRTPAERPAAPMPPESPLRGIRSKAREELRRRTQILLIEDNPVNQQVTLRTIERIGYPAEAAVNGRAALERLVDQKFDLMLMDCQMPELDGYDTTRAIRRREGESHHTPIVGLTAYALPGDREKCLEAGMDDYLSKPVMPEDLAAMIDKYMMAAEEVRMARQSPHQSVSAEHSPTGPNGKALAVLDEKVLLGLREFQRPGEPDFLTQLVGVFEEEVGRRLSDADAGIKAGNFERVRLAAHALKGSSAEIGAQRMQEIAERLEMRIVEGATATVPAVVQELKGEAALVIAALESYCAENGVRASQA